MNPDHPRYSPELAMAVTAWEAFDGKDKVTQADIERWTKEHAKDFPKLLKVVKGKLSISVSASERISTVVSWNKAGRPSKGSSE